MSASSVINVPPRWTCAGCSLQLRSDRLPAGWTELLGDVRCRRCSATRSSVPDAGPLPEDHHRCLATAMLGGSDEPDELFDLERRVFGVAFEHLQRTRPGSRHEHARDAGRAAGVLARNLAEGQTVQAAASQLGIGKRSAEAAKRLGSDAVAGTRLEDGRLPEPSATVAALYRPDLAA